MLSVRNHLFFINLFFDRSKNLGKKIFDITKELMDNQKA